MYALHSRRHKVGRFYRLPEPPYAKTSKGHANMRKLILQMQVSVDGYVGQTGRDPSWQLWNWGDKCPWDEKLQAEFNQFFEAADTILLSSKIVKGGYIDHWAETVKKHP